MCLGIPGRVVELGDRGQLVKAEVAGVRRTINADLLVDERLEVGDWILIHMGFAMEIIDATQAATALEGLELMGRGQAQEPEHDTPGRSSGP